MQDTDEIAVDPNGVLDMSAVKMIPQMKPTSKAKDISIEQFKKSMLALEIALSQYHEVKLESSG